MNAENPVIDVAAIRQLSFEALDLLPAFEKPVLSPSTDTARYTVPPLIVDLDGSLILTDSLVESFLGLLKEHPTAALAAVFQLIKGRAEFKQFVAERSQLDVSSLPYRTDLLDYIRVEKENGRRIVLATAAHHDIARAVAAHLQVFDDVIASDAKVNLKGEKKLDAIRKLVGEEFVYVGDSAADLPIWEASHSAITVNTTPFVTRKVRESTHVERDFRPTSMNWTVWPRALRCHQWVKNLLLFVPLLTGFAFSTGEAFSSSVLAFISFCLAASGTYIGNDLWDIDNDRAHPRKKNRAFASGQISVIKGVAASLSLLTASLLIAAFVSINFLLILICYVVITTTYSWTLKRYVLIDVITLAVLYTLRVLAGSVVTDLPMTYWLFAFSIFTFFSLALVKRCAELTTLKQSNKPAAHGRDYRVEDLIVLYPLGIAAGLCSVVVFGLYVGSAGAHTQYSHPGFLWLVGVGLIYWVSRLWIKTVRGEMHDDPIVFALKDFGSRVVIGGMIAVTLAATFFE
jgi:4-hydroxybenzoate polyprenyltransferase/phosphoserine phosphatase